MKIDELKKYKIAILAGGTSSEREISLKTGQSIYESLINTGLNIQIIDVKESSESFLENNNFDVAFIALHGEFGEDGTVQTILRNKGIKFTGSGPVSSKLAMDKELSKEIFINKGIGTPPYIVVEKFDRSILKIIKFPCVVKPTKEGSSIGLAYVENEQSLEQAILEAKKYSTRILIEDFIPGRELTAGVLIGKAMPVVEIIPEGIMYNFDSKYKNKSTKYIVPAVLENKYETEIKKVAVNAYNALGCSGAARVDIRFTDKGGIYVLEINTIPGFTERSLLPMAAASSGISFTDLCLTLLLAAFENDTN
ncbi:MAG: D-alanine--D-alanine ligase [Candidatus Omnitrophica bacterium]|nr:D-alanine--D-alanine ligase [Candidatus Omnitrophota bacterium]